MLLKTALALVMLALCVCASAPHDQSTRTARAPSLEKIAERVWIHKSYKDIPPYGLVLSQGMVVQVGNEAVLVDSAWSDADTLALLDLVTAQLKLRVSEAVVTHAHEDKMGGVGALRARGVKVHAAKSTNDDAIERKLNVADEEWPEPFVQAKLPPESDAALEIFYSGPGHTRDNIVVYWAPAKVLFGGCLIRPIESENLGNTADADIAHWAQAVRAVAARFPDAQIVVPSHGAKGGRELLDHTIALAEAAAK